MYASARHDVSGGVTRGEAGVSEFRTQFAVSRVETGLGRARRELNLQPEEAPPCVLPPDSPQVAGSAAAAALASGSLMQNTTVVSPLPMPRKVRLRTLNTGTWNRK